MITKVDRFASSGTWTVPSGVTYAVAHIRGAGGGAGTGSSGAGGTSSVAFASGTVSATGGAGRNTGGLGLSAWAGAANSGEGADVLGYLDGSAYTRVAIGGAGRGAYIVAGGAVTAGTGISVTVGGGGTAGTSGAAGGGGYVWIEYQVAL